MTELRVGLCGIGQVALTRYVPLLDQHTAVVTAVADPSATARSAVRDRGWAVHDSLGAMLAAGDIDLVAVLTPGPTHPELVESSLRHGVHTYCEKPLAYDADHCRRLFDLADANHAALVSAPAFGRSPALQSHRVGEAAGRVTLAHAQCVEPGPGRSPWSQGDPAHYYDPAARGCLYDLGIYGVDALLCLFGLDVQVVASASQRYHAAAPSWTAILRWPHGTVASLDVSWDGGGGAPSVTWYSHEETSRIALWALAATDGIQRWKVGDPPPDPPLPDFSGPTVGWGLAWMLDELDRGTTPSSRMETCAVIDVLDRVWNASS